MFGQSADKFLRGALLVNSKVAAGLGAGLFLAAGPAAELFGLPTRFGWGTSVAIIFLVGISLILFAAGLAPSARASTIDRRVPKVVLLINATWTVGLAALLLVPSPVPIAGQWLLGIAAAIAAMFTALQAYAIWLGHYRELATRAPA